MIHIMTGHPKSGNSWVGRMVREIIVPGQLGHEIFDWVQSHWVNHVVIQYHREAATRIPARRLFERLLLQRDSLGVDLDSDDKDRLKNALAHLARSIRIGMARSNVETSLTVGDIVELLFQRAMTEGGSSNDKNVLSISKHTPVDRIAKVFPDTRIVWLIRDPRDVLVSYFFHDLGCLTDSRLELIFQDSERKCLKSDKGSILSILSDRKQSIIDYFSHCPPITSLPDNVLLIRYEDLLRDCVAKLKEMAEFVGEPLTDDLADNISNRFQFANLSGSNGESGSLLRKGISGDWKNYLSQYYRPILDEEFVALVENLGYAHNQNWLDDLESEASHQFDLSKYRPVSTTLYHFEPLWLDREDLQRSYPNPYQSTEEGSFYSWLQQQTDSYYTDWFALCERISNEFGCVENDSRRHGESQLGF